MVELWNVLGFSSGPCRLRLYTCIGWWYFSHENLRFTFTFFLATEFREFRDSAVQTTFFSSKTLIKRTIPTTQEYMYLYAYYANNAYIKYLQYLTMPNMLT